MTQDQAISIIAPAAIESERTSGLPAEITAAQCAVESGWLKSCPGNNCFGIKFSARHMDKQLLVTREFFHSAAEAAAWAAAVPGRVLIGATGVRTANRVEYRVKDWFASFTSLADCFTDHARLLVSGSPYRRAWSEFTEHRSWRRLLSAIAPVYATAPNYESSILAILQNGLAEAIEKERGK